MCIGMRCACKCVCAFKMIESISVDNTCKKLDSNMSNQYSPFATYKSPISFSSRTVASGDWCGEQLYKFNKRKSTTDRNKKKEINPSITTTVTTKHTQLLLPTISFFVFWEKRNTPKENCCKSNVSWSFQFNYYFFLVSNFSPFIRKFCACEWCVIVWFELSKTKYI